MLAQISDSIIIEVIKKSVINLCNKDNYLLQNKVREECVNHRLSIHLESSLNDCPSTAQLFAHNLVIDCEYDKHLGCDKTGVGITDMRPDVTVHERGTDSNNFLFIEIKKKWRI